MNTHDTTDAALRIAEDAAEDYTGSAGDAPAASVGTATYSPDDNKLRLYPVSRLSAEHYERVRAAGFRWAPKQELFFAPMWTPGREDLLLKLCGEIDDDDRSLVDRAEERADRFTDYSEKRAEESSQATAAVDAITEHIPLGQPILIGHHSEKRARKDAERVQNGMRRAVRLWETSEYWKSRARNALLHAKYKERPDVRARRIKAIESEARKHQRIIDETQARVAAWSAPALTDAEALRLADRLHMLYFPDPSHPSGQSSAYTLLAAGRMTTTDVRERVLRGGAARIEYSRRWVAHCGLRIDYERAMLGESGGLAADAFALAVGGKVKAYGEWLTILRLNRKAGNVVSVSATAPTRMNWTQKVSVPYEKITEYQAPTPESAKAAKAPPLVNHRSPECEEMTSAQYRALYSGYKGTRTATETGTHGAYRYRVTVARGRLVPVFLTDAKESEPPPPSGLPAPRSEPAASAPRVSKPATSPTPEAERIGAMRDTLRAGVQVAVAPQLFPTPAGLASRAVDHAQLQDGMSLLEPSAGTGALLDAVRDAGIAAVLTAVELNHDLAARLAQRFDGVRQGDFLQLAPAALGTFDRVLMNPPFANAADIAHVRHAIRFLKPGGVLVAICANGPRQQDQLRPMAEASGGEWHDLPADAFKDQGTQVRTALLVYRAPA